MRITYSNDLTRKTKEKEEEGGGVEGTEGISKAIYSGSRKISVSVYSKSVFPGRNDLS